MKGLSSSSDSTPVKYCIFGPGTIRTPSSFSSSNLFLSLANLVAQTALSIIAPSMGGIPLLSCPIGGRCHGAQRAGFAQAGEALDFRRRSRFPPRSCEEGQFEGHGGRRELT